LRVGVEKEWWEVDSLFAQALTDMEGVLANSTHMYSRSVLPEKQYHDVAGSFFNLVSSNSYYEKRYFLIETSATFPCFTILSTSVATSLRGVNEHLRKVF
jgi:hypothetical protein